MGLIFLISYSLFNECFSCHLSRYYFRNILLLVWWVWLVVFVVAFICFHIVGHIVFFSLFCYLPDVDFQTLLINGFGTLCDLLHSLVCVLKYACGIGLLISYYMCVIASWKYLFKTLHFLNVMSHCHGLYFGCFDLSFWYFYLFLSYVVWFLLSVPNVQMLSFFLHIMVMVDCLIDSYFWICVSLCSIALSPFCCTCLIVHFSFDGGFVWVWPVLCLYLCI